MSLSVRVSFRARRRIVALGVVVAVGWVVAGCTGGDEPDPTPSVEETVEPSPTETPDPEPTETGPVKPERPAAMDRDDGEGAAAAAEYFLSLYDNVLASGDSVEWEAMTWAETCSFCTAVRDRALDVHSSGDTFTGSEITVSNPDIGEYDDFVGGYPILFDFEQTPHQRIAPDGSVVSEDQGAQGALQVDMKHLEDGWIVLAVTSAS